jgi:hypothetical protein
MVDLLLAEIASNDWLLNNCYQVDVSLWRVSLRKPTNDGGVFCSSWAEGATLEEALEECMSKLAEAEFSEDIPQSFTREIEAAKVGGQSLLMALGLRKPIKRRV